VKDGGVVEDALLFEMIEDAPDVVVDGDETGVIVLGHTFERTAGDVGRCGADLVFRVDEALGFARVALEVVVEGKGLRDGDSVVEIEVTAWAEEGLVRSDEPDEDAEGFVAAVLVDPGECFIGGEIVGIDVVVLHLRSDGAVAALLEERVGVVVAGVVVAEVVVPMALFDTVVHVNLAEDSDLIPGLFEEIGEERNVGRKRYTEVLVGERACRAGVHAGERGCTRRSAESVSAEGVVEPHSLLANAVVVRRVEDGMTGEGEGIGALTFAEEVDEVRALRLCLSCCRGCCDPCGCECAGDSQCSLQEVTSRSLVGGGSRRSFRIVVIGRRHQKPFLE